VRRLVPERVMHRRVQSYRRRTPNRARTTVRTRRRLLRRRRGTIRDRDVDEVTVVVDVQQFHRLGVDLTVTGSLLATLSPTLMPRSARSNRQPSTPSYQVQSYAEQPQLRLD
jgi:hypothetical protein